MSAQCRDVLRNPAVDSEDQRENQFGNSDGVFSRAIGDKDATRAGGFNINRVYTGAGPEHEGKSIGRLEGFSGDLFATDDKKIVRSDVIMQVLGGDAWLVCHIAA